MSLIRVWGIQLEIHPLFILVLFLSVWAGFFLELILLFVLVMVHEAGHVIAAKSLGWRVLKVSLLPFGGVAEVEEQGTVTAWEEMVVAAAGPLQHVILIGFALGFGGLGLWGEMWTEYFIRVNVILALFNLLPVLPLDGGKIIQSLLSLFLPYYRTIWICTWVSLILSFVIIGLSVSVNTGGIHINLLAIGLYLLYSNWYQYKHLWYHFLRFLMQRKTNEKLGYLVHYPPEILPAMPRHSINELVKQLRRNRIHWFELSGADEQYPIYLSESKILHHFFKHRD